MSNGKGPPCGARFEIRRFKMVRCPPRLLGASSSCSSVSQTCQHDELRPCYDNFHTTSVMFSERAHGGLLFRSTLYRTLRWGRNGLLPIGHYERFLAGLLLVPGYLSQRLEYRCIANNALGRWKCRRVYGSRNIWLPLLPKVRHSFKLSFSLPSHSLT